MPPMHAPAPATAAPAPAPPPASGPLSTSPWTLTEADGMLYKRMWSAANAAGRGKVGMQASHAAALAYPYPYPYPSL